MFIKQDFILTCNLIVILWFIFQIAQKYDPQKEEELRFWIEEVTGMCIGENFQQGLKDGVILCEYVLSVTVVTIVAAGLGCCYMLFSFSLRLINKLQPGSVKRINLSQLNWHKVKTCSELETMQGFHMVCW